MKVLALDTSNRPLTVAILDDNQVLATESTTVHQKHAEYLLPIIDELFKKVDMKPSDLQRVVVANGPGSYTGIRIATATAKTLAYTLNIDLVGVSSLLTLALNVQEEGSLVMPIFDARNNNIFTGLYKIENGLPKSILEDQHTDFDKWLDLVGEVNSNVYVLGDFDNFNNKLSDQYNNRFKTLDGFSNLPQAAKLGIYGQKQSPVNNIHGFVPNYLRLTKAEADWKKNNPEASETSYVEKFD
ncbi:tRNA (adenosine(37)-N6)-threonylcarbamoyltransferase complex dimerization subunit type 1 TsaB [Apilactobacillus apisilvae]|uniref:tRNA (Adenosine(37)-N6)-threonylcarbamoyltransferase complex dimerization subunit type 1 TsaB n=1 Tax=Apilactobacillus apisilvae TaxID=2923364 RepID=A0ABY4PH29_9LACO|nr:tRNA (adenosine(37)-N6)-threonylcarbamoyltransferase complex dimerization subunit type 1 TsaB [Apilactobacillus apisilvae]UQS85064.1 tRNA (adenosine(37)-N6)-threonylcarbamoyltransferase complex dimerization subunit type 1 TsaB [Apilactobacillus apisilvae]